MAAVRRKRPIDAIHAEASQRREQKSTKSNMEYVEGAIVRIKLENILTYDSVEFQTGPYLNVIIGPNGTGKSTIVCAICLGLGGKIGLLGRAQQAAEFIKYGKQKGIIELELFNTDGDNYVIVREIHRNNQSQWNVNGRGATLKAVEELVMSKNIQVGNLCQFLPQEKVADFAKMTQEELLENTEKAVGPPDMYENHMKLKEARNESRSLKQGFENLEERLAQNINKNSRLEQDVKNFQERERHLEKVEILQKKRPWIEYDEKRKAYDVVKRDRDSKMDSLKQAKVQFEPLQRRLDEIAAKKEKADLQMKQKTNSLRDFATKAQANSKEIEAATDKQNEILDDLNLKKTEENSRRKRIQDLQRQVDALQSEYQNTDEQENLQPLLEKATNEMRAVNRKMTQIHEEGEGIRRGIADLKRQVDGYQQELRRIQNVENKRMEILRGKDKDTYNAVLWYKENKHQFRGNVHLPMMLSINPKDASFAKYIEMHISAKDFQAFVFEDSEDYTNFMNMIRDEQKLKVNAVKVPQAPLSSFKPKYSIDHYRQYGFQGYLRDYMHCPEGVMRYLCAQYNVHAIPVGNRKTKDCIEDIKRDHPELRTFFTDDYQGFQDELKKQEEKYRDLQRQSKELEVRMNRLREEKKQLTQKKDQKKKLLSQIENKKQRIKTEEAEAINLQAEKERTKKKTRDINIKKCKSLQLMKGNTQKCLELIMGKVRLSLQHASIVKDQEIVEEELRDQSQHLVNLERSAEEAKLLVRQTKDSAKHLLDLAKRATRTAANAELSNELRERFEQYPATLDEIDAMIHEEQARADSLFQADKSIVKEYEARKKEIAALEAELEKRRRTMAGHQEEIERAKQQWLEPLKGLIDTINDNFSYFFSCMNCAGEIELHQPENQEDYEKYGVKIKVKFRDAESLRELTPHHQSGGERSVATVLYMMALQELAKCPFRCVDEINQGMDPVNERKVFELVVQTVCKKSSSQYFLLTPKLLPDLLYADNMTVLCVYNGPSMLNHTEWNLKKFLRRRRKIED
ncbi:Structural maintenance of chromosomes protein 5 [Mizuhopecten yessoensis]|uniref:Structural maintenance of chromosomes protein 5 n=1 Tax=Mizuhopecten yessoensis TaxID=6573 RepID=A0A210QBR8_MIZYE|nr:Structural maintenance of chromosomes protein 5 [Mizuhopecten yessoensis]